MEKRSIVSLPLAVKIITAHVKSCLETGTKADAPILYGRMGMGKSEAIKSIADSFNGALVDVRLGSMEHSDVMGIPFVNGDDTRFSTPEWFKECISLSKEHPVVILFLDEITNCTVPVQQSAYRLILDRSITNGTKLPNNVVVIAAGNRLQDGTGARPLKPALANRFNLHLELEDSPRSFLEWAFVNPQRIDPMVAAYLETHQQNISGEITDNDPAFATPRSWEMLSGLRNNNLLSKAEKVTAYCACVGTKIGSDFAAYDEYFEFIPDWKVLRSPQGDAYAKDFNLKQDEPAVRLAIGLICAQQLRTAYEAKETEFMKNLVTLMKRFSDETLITAFRMLTRNDTTEAMRIIAQPSIREIFMKVKDVMIQIIELEKEMKAK